MKLRPPSARHPSDSSAAFAPVLAARFGAAAVAGCLALLACGEVPDSGSPGNGGNGGSAGSTGGPLPSGGTAPAGGTASGGTNPSGGRAGTGGAGGATGGASAASGNGGAALTGGSDAGAAGTTSSGGKSSAGGMPAGGTSNGGTSSGGTSSGGTSSAGTSSAGTSSAGTSSAGTDSGSGGKACQSNEDWTPQAEDLWISPSGDDSNAGTEDSPKKNLTAAISAWSSGKTIWVTAGTYSYNAPISISSGGSAAGSLRISGVTGGAKPVIDFSGEPRASNNDGERGIQLSGSYVHLRYLEIQEAADNCVYVTGSNNVLEWLTVHECQDTGVQLSNGAADNQVLNVDSFLNADPTGENADGFAPKLSIGQNNYFCGTRSYHNSDDGYDCWAAGDGSPVTFEYCWAFGQPGPTATSQSDGNGFKLGSPADRASGGNAAHQLISCFAFENRGTGFTANGNNSGDITCTNCGAWGNGTAWSSGTGGVTPEHTGDITNLNVSVEEAMNAPRDANGNLPDITRL
jgi:hypothetical protein